MTPLRRSLEVFRLIVALSVFLTSLLVVLPAPSYLGWELSVAATECGHILALLALLALVPGWKRTLTGRISAVLGAVAFVLALSPLVRAMSVASSLPGAVTSAFGPSEPRSLRGAPPRPKPLVVSDLIRGVRSPLVRVDTATYLTRDGVGLKLDLYRPIGNTTAPLPLVMMIHGGAWRARARDDLSPLNRYLAARGYAVASADYSLVPRYPHPAASQDIHAAIKFLESNASHLGIDPTRVALIGRSAGGQLALLEAYTASDPGIRGGVGMYAPTDQVFGYEHPSNPRVLNSTEMLEDFLTGNPRTAAEAYRTSSPINFIGASSPPTLLIHGVKDELVSVQQSERLDQRLTAAHRPHLFLRMPWATHGCDYFFSGPCGQMSTYVIERFLGAILR